MRRSWRPILGLAYVRLTVRDSGAGNGSSHTDEASGPAEALSLAEERSAPIHLVLMDVSMLNTADPAVAWSSGGQSAGVKMLYTTGDPEGTLGNQESGGVSGALLQKPFTMMALLAKVREVLNGHIL
jgi:DNA-binding response OmpR family regulator